MRRIFFCAILVLLVLYRHGYAQCSGTCSCSNAATNNVSNIEKGQLKAGLSGDYYSFHPLTDQQLEDGASSSFACYSAQTQMVARVNMQYAFSNKVYATAWMPYFFSQNILEGHLHNDGTREVHDLGNMNGAGDAGILINYVFINNQKSGWALRGGVGAKLPTGVKNDQSTTGVVLPLHLQPGSGSVDALAQVAMQKSIGHFIFSDEDFLSLTSACQSHRMGSYFSSTVKASRNFTFAGTSFISALQPELGVQFQHAAHVVAPAGHDHSTIDTTSAVFVLATDANTGFNRIMAQAGITPVIAKHLFIPLILQLPVWQHNNGTQPKLQYVASAGILFIF